MGPIPTLVLCNEASIPGLLEHEECAALMYSSIQLARLLMEAKHAQ
jgi:hypothetical protein